MFWGTEVDDVSYGFACKNVEKNNLNDRIGWFLFIYFYLSILFIDLFIFLFLFFYFYFFLDLYV